jgi:hypothetical protein
MPHHFNFWMPDDLMDSLRSMSAQTGDSAAEWLRKMIVYCRQPQVFCNMVPSYLSGQIKIGA